MGADADRWVSQRLATEALAQVCAISERRARRVLSAGLAGEPRRERGALLYRESRLLDLVDRETVTDAVLDACCPNGLFVARRDPGGAGWPQLRGGWRFSPWTAIWLRVRIERHGYLPLVATVGGFVAECADIVGAWSNGTLDLAAPSEWSSALRDRRLPTGRGRDWWIRGLDKPRGRLHP